MPPSVARTQLPNDHACTRNKGTARNPLSQRVFGRVLHKQHATVMGTFRANACFCLTFPIGSQLSSLHCILGAKSRCPHETSACAAAKRIEPRAPATSNKGRPVKSRRQPSRREHTRIARARSAGTHHGARGLIAELRAGSHRCRSVGLPSGRRHALFYCLPRRNDGSRSRREHVLATCRCVGHIGAAGDVAEWLKAAVC
jgi:hypothetical protein